MQSLLDNKKDYSDILLDNKKEYTDIILDNITSPICNIIYNMYKSSNNIIEFQSKLIYIKNWNYNTIQEYYIIIIKNIKHNYINNLLHQIIIFNIKLKTNNIKQKINFKKLKLITPDDFIHKCLINCGIYCWKHAYLFSHKNLKPSEKQYHLNIIEKNLRKIIKNTIRDCTPFELFINSNNYETNIFFINSSFFNEQKCN